MKKVTLVARNEAGASTEFKGFSKAEAILNFKHVFNTKNWTFEFFDETGKSI